MIRIVEPADEELYLIVQLQNGVVMKCDVEHIEHVEDSVWSAWSGQQKVWYARRRASKKLQQEYISFHVLVSPDYREVIHINRDGLDNRSINLKEKVRVIAKNEDTQINNVSGYTGVYYESGAKASWKAQIGTRGNQRKKSFSVKMYGYHEAREMAIQVRMEWEKELK